MLEQKCVELREEVKDEITNDLQKLLKEKTPDIVTLQEVVSYKQPADNDMINIIDKERIDELGYK